MKPLQGLVVAILVLSSLMAVIALFMNIGAPVGLDPKRILALRQQNTQQCARATSALAQLAPVKDTLVNTTIDEGSLTLITQCSVVDAVLRNQSETRNTLLLAFDPSSPLSTLVGPLNDAASELEALSLLLNGTGLVKILWNGTVESNLGVTPPLGYSLRTLTLGGDSLYFVQLEKTGLLQSTLNVSNIVLSNWDPPIATSTLVSPLDRVDSVMDRQQEKIQTSPTPLVLRSISYDASTSVTLGSSPNEIPLGSYFQILEATQILF